MATVSNVSKDADNANREDSAAANSAEQGGEFFPVRNSSDFTGSRRDN
jgi:hypothetical protein